MQKPMPSNGQVAPFYQGNCSAVGCPSTAMGTNLQEGCSCPEGHEGSVTATAEAPYFKRLANEKCLKSGVQVC